MLTANVDVSAMDYNDDLECKPNDFSASDCALEMEQTVFSIFSIQYIFICIRNALHLLLSNFSSSLFRGLFSLLIARLLMLLEIQVPCCWCQDGNTQAKDD